ncbi:hypothetical protein ACFVUN_16220 [Kitasatospora griseola]
MGDDLVPVARGDPVSGAKAASPTSVSPGPTDTVRVVSAPAVQRLTHRH